jgi:GMP synthase-like glutamine amidotransferase
MPRRDQSPADLVHGLVVEAVDLDLCPVDGGGEAAGVELHGVHGDVARHLEAGVAVTCVRGQILDQRAAECDVQNLDATADTEDRQTRGARDLDQRELPRVALGLGCPAPGLPLLAVPGGIDVGATAEDESVEALDDRVDRSVPAQFDGQPPGRGDGTGVVREVEVDVGRPDGSRHSVAEDARRPPPAGHADERRPLREFDHRQSIVAGASRATVQRQPLPLPPGTAASRRRPPDPAGTVGAMRVLVLRHHEEDAPGLIGDAFEAHGATVDTHLYPDDGPLPDLDGYDHLVVLGSSASVYQMDEWIAAEIDWLRDVQLPVLGICFGAQLLSASFGGAVERSPVYEVGWVTVDPVDSVDSAPGGEPVDSPAIGRGPWFQFHGDRCVLPDTARLLASNEVSVQAFTIGRRLGVQFHPEIDASQLQRWFENGGRQAAIAAGKDPDLLLEETAREEPDARERAKDLVGAFLEYVSA